MKSRELDTLLAATMFLMSRCRDPRERNWAPAVIQHLQMLMDQPGIRDSCVLMNACRLLHIEWGAKALQAPAQCERHRRAIH